ncbi:hypothetical protein LguiB_002894 [Lonicera macranthoides]
MATTTLLKLLTILSLLTASAFSTDLEDDTEDEYILDAPFNHTRLRSRFLASIKKGTYCDDQYANNVCNGVSANQGKSLLYCCKTHCRNIWGDRNNCGRCGNKCTLGELCCSGTCTRVAYNNAHCGKCNNECSNGHTCHYGFCGYA